MSETRFQRAHHPTGISDVVNFQPFENTEENRALVEESVRKIADEFPELEISYQMWENRDAGMVVAKRCTIQISG